MELQAHDDYYDIEAAIRTGDVAYARERLRELIRQQPTADVWYLAAMVARTPQQRRSLLEKALSSDPDHEHAREALAATVMPTTSPVSTTILERLRHIFR